MPDFPRPGAHQFFSAFNITAFAMNEDESQLVFCGSLNGKFNLWGLCPSSPFPFPLTHQNQHSDAITIVEGRGHQQPFVLYTGDHDGDEAFQMYAVPTFGGDPVPIRTSPGYRHFFGALSTDGRRLYYTSNKDLPMYLQTYCYDFDTQEETVVFEGSGAATYLAAVSPSETTFVFTKLFGRTHIPAVILHNEKVLSPFPDSEKKCIVYQVDFLDDEKMYLLTNYGEDFSYVATYNLVTGEFQKLVGIEGEEIRMMVPSASGNTLYLVASQGVYDRLYTYEPATGVCQRQPVPVDTVDQVTVAQSGTVYLLGSSFKIPQNIFRCKRDGEWQRLTENRLQGVSSKATIQPLVLRYPSYDGLRVESLYFPANLARNNGHTIIWPHGGPQHAERMDFNSTFQYFAHLGYSIFAPNFRGSMYYGDAFHRLVEADWGGGPRLDIVAGMEWLVAEGLAERDKLFVVGGSYGGYMALLLLGRHGEWFKAGVDLFGPCNLFTLVESVPDYWKPRMVAWVGHPERDRAKLQEHSPITYKNSMNKPLLIFHGANDARVAQDESDQIVEALRDRGVAVEYVVLDDEGHSGFARENEIRMHQQIAEFLGRHL